MNIKSHRRHVESTTYNLSFDYADMPGAGFAFPCSADGAPHYDDFSNVALLNLALCYSGAVEGRAVVAKGVVAFHHSYVEPAVGICDECGAEVYLDGFTCTCDCGADYNSAGQRLAPREQWGEETGESLSDILSIK